jgi:O-antigen/teichoic acid export membrane protein
LSLKTRAIQGVFWAATSIFGARLLNLLATLILAKLLAPSDFGLVAIAHLVVMTAQVFRDLGLAQALIYRSDDAKEAANTAFFLVIAWGMLLYLLISIIASRIALFFSEPSAKLVIQGMALTLIISSLGTVPAALLEKELEFRKKVLPEIISTAGYALTAIGLAAAGLGVWSIVWGRIGQAALTVVLMWTASRWRLKLSFDRHVAGEILNYGKHILGSFILNIVFLYIDNVYVGRLLGITALGFYAFAFDLANLPMQSVTAIIHKVSFPTYVKLREDRGSLASAYLQSLKLTSLITFPAAMGLAILSPDLLWVLYADKWASSMVLVQILSFYGLFRSIGGLPSNIFLATGKQHLLPRLQLVYVGTVAVLLWPATRWLGTMGTSLVMTSVIAIGAAVFLALANHYLDIPLSRLIRTLMPQVIASAVMVSCLLLIGSLFEMSLFVLLALVATGAGIYLLSILLITKGEAYKEIADVVKTLLNVRGPTLSGF